MWWHRSPLWGPLILALPGQHWHPNPGRGLGLPPVLMMVSLSDGRVPLVESKVWSLPGSQALSSSSAETELPREDPLQPLTLFFFSVTHFISCKSNCLERSDKHSQAERFSARY